MNDRRSPFARMNDLLDDMEDTTIAGTPIDPAFCDRFARLSMLCESPIETRFFAHLCMSNWRVAAQSMIELHDTSEALPMLADLPFTIAPQYRVGRSRLDFAIFVRSALGRAWSIDVECDGHDFHDRTPEQASHDRARDRDLQQRGWTVFRFTGRDVMRQGKELAQEVSTFCADLIAREGGAPAANPWARYSHALADFQRKPSEESARHLRAVYAVAARSIMTEEEAAEADERLDQIIGAAMQQKAA